MARIRSVHPGLFTDEGFVGLSAEAQVFFIGLWTEADDQGLFEWRPSRLHLRIMPTKPVNVADLLSELERADPPMICAFEHGGKRFGAIRNFRRWQKPKTPNAIHTLPDSLREYVGLKAEQNTNGQPSDDDEASGDADFPETEKSPPLKQGAFPPNGEIDALMEEGGGKREDEVGEDIDSTNRISVSPRAIELPRPTDAEAEALIEAADAAISEHFPGRRRRRHANDLAIARGWAERRIGPDRLAAIVSAQVERHRVLKPDDMPSSLRFFEAEVDRAEPPPQYPLGIASDDDRQWYDLVVAWKVKGVWITRRGAKPDDPATMVPDHVLAAHGLTRRKVRAA